MGTTLNNEGSCIESKCRYMYKNLSKIKNNNNNETVGESTFVKK